MGKPLCICYKRLDCDLSRAQAFKYESRADCDAAGPFGVVCGGSPSLERLSCCKYPRRWLWLCGFWVLDDSSLRWHRSGTINGFFRPQFALAEALTWSMRLDMRLFHTVARLHSFVCYFFGLWWKKNPSSFETETHTYEETSQTYLMWCAFQWKVGLFVLWCK